MITECFYLVQGNIVKNLKSRFKEFRRPKKGTSGGNSVGMYLLPFQNLNSVLHQLESLLIYQKYQKVILFVYV